MAAAQEASPSDEATYYDGAEPADQLAYGVSSGVSVTHSDVTGYGCADGTAPS